MRYQNFKDYVSSQKTHFGMLTCQMYLDSVVFSVNFQQKTLFSWYIYNYVTINIKLISKALPKLSITWLHMTHTIINTPKMAERRKKLNQKMHWTKAKKIYFINTLTTYKLSQMYTEATQNIDFALISLKDRTENIQL